MHLFHTSNWNLVFHVYLNCAMQEEALQFLPVLLFIFVFFLSFLSVHTGTTKEGLPYIIAPYHKSPRAALVFHVAQ